MINYDKTAIIATGCIAPAQNIPALVLNDTALRLQHYRDSLKWLIDDTPMKKIIFCENSNYAVQEDLVEYANAKGKQLEWLAFQGDAEKAAKYGKSYGEGEIMEYALEHSEIIKKVTYICKLTGRLKIKNLATFCRVAKNGDFFMHYQQYSFRALDAVDTRFYAMSLEHYKEFYRKVHLNCDESKAFFLEHAFYKQCMENQENTNTWLNRLFLPEISGTSGSLGVSYDSAKYKMAIKWLLCVMGFYLPRKIKAGI